MQEQHDHSQRRNITHQEAPYPIHRVAGAQFTRFLAASLEGVHNLSVAVKEWDEKVVFLHKLVPGAADKSYGIHVARLAGVPKIVNERAKEVLAQLEDEHLDSEGQPKIAAKAKSKAVGELQLSLFGAAEHPLLEDIRELDVNATTPLEALALIHRWQKRLADD